MLVKNNYYNYENKKIQREGEQLDESFFDFIDKLSELGGYARTEQSHSNFTYEDENLVIDTIKEYEDLLKKVNDKFSKVKEKLKEAYNMTN